MAYRRDGTLLALVHPLGRAEGGARFQTPALQKLKPALPLGPSKEQMMEAPRGRGADRPLLLDEPELLARCRAGETAAFATLVDRYRDRAYGLAFRLTRSAPDAEEVAQDAFVSAWRSLGAFRGDAERRSGEAGSARSERRARSMSMTLCDDLNRWLDEGLPMEGAAGTRAHAASCPACAKALASFEAMDRALALPAPSLTEGAAFTARVMEQVRTESPLAFPAIPETTRVRWWISLLSEPGFAVAATAAVVLVLTPAAIRFDAGQSVALPVSVAMHSLGTQLGNTLASWFDPAPLAERLSPLSRTYILIGFAPLLVWAGLWMFGAVERLVRTLPAHRG